MTTIRLTPADLSALRQGKTIERTGGPSIKIMLSEQHPATDPDVALTRMNRTRSSNLEYVAVRRADLAAVSAAYWMMRDQCEPFPPRSHDA